MIRTLAQGFSGLSFFQNRKKKIFGILVFFFLVSSIPISVYLVKQQQDIRSRAQETPVVFGNSKVTPGQLSFGSLSKSSPKAVKTLTIESLVSTASATPTTTNTEMPTPSPATQSPATQSTEETSSSQTTYIDSRVGCDVKEGTTPDEICKQRGFLGAPQTTPDYGLTVAQGFWWKQCGGATLTTCTKLDCNIAQLDCTNTPGEWGTQQPYPQNYLKVGNAQTLYKPDDLGLDCTGYSPGWTMRVACLEAAASSPAPSPSPSPTSTPSPTITPTTTTTETPSNYTLKPKDQTEGVSLSFSEEAFSLKQGENKILTITLEINPDILKEGSYQNEIILNIDQINYSIPLSFNYSIPILNKLGMGGKEIYQKENDLDGKRKEVKELSRNIENLNGQLLLETSRVNTSNILVIKDIVFKRKDMWLKLAESSPSAVLTHLLPKETRNNLPFELRSQVEEEIETKGRLNIVHQDDFNEGISTNIYMLEKEGNDLNKYTLYFASMPPPLNQNNTKIAVKGLIIDNVIVVTSTFSDYTALGRVSSDRTTGMFRTAVVTFKFRNTPFLARGEDLSQNDIREIANVTRDYYAEVSYNQATLENDLYGPYIISMDQTCTMSGFFEAADLVIRAADVDINFRNYDKIAILGPYGWPDTGTCSIAGYSFIYDLSRTGDGDDRIIGGALISTTLQNPITSITSTLIHELGHSFKLSHASDLRCPGAIDEYYRCVGSDYGDPTDVMGGWRPYHFNGPHKIQLGWLSDTAVRTVTENGVFTISPLEIATSSAQVLRIPKSNTGEDYYIEYRRPIGFDGDHRWWNGTPINLFSDGATIHVWDKSRRDNTKLVYASPPRISLVDGGNFYDNINAIRIKQLGHNSNGVTVEVTFSSRADRLAPTVSMASPVNGGTISGNAPINVETTDTSGIQKVEFYIFRAFNWDAVNRITDPPFTTVSSPPYTAYLDTTRYVSGSSINLYARAYDRAGESLGEVGNIKNTPVIRLLINNIVSPYAYITLELGLEGVGGRGNLRPVTTRRQVQLKVLDGGNRQVLETVGNIVYDGSSSFRGGVNLGGSITSGTYDLIVKVDKYLAKRIPNIPIILGSGANYFVPLVTLSAGDVNNDNNINISDFTLLRQCFFKNTSSPEWNTCQASDFNDDGRISVTDYSRLVTNFNQRGE